jgi:hypothetical protein
MQTLTITACLALLAIGAQAQEIKPDKATELEKQWAYMEILVTGGDDEIAGHMVHHGLKSQSVGPLTVHIRDYQRKLEQAGQEFWNAACTVKRNIYTADKEAYTADLLKLVAEEERIKREAINKLGDVLDAADQVAFNSLIGGASTPDVYRIDHRAVIANPKYSAGEKLVQMCDTVSTSWEGKR